MKVCEYSDLSYNNVSNHKWKEMPKLFIVIQVQVIVLVV